MSIFGAGEILSVAPGWYDIMSANEFRDVHVYGKD
jgi:hypothetical protein